MGLFDRIKKAFSGNDDSKEEPKKTTPEEGQKEATESDQEAVEEKSTETQTPTKTSEPTEETDQTSEESDQQAEPEVTDSNQSVADTAEESAVETETTEPAKEPVHEEKATDDKETVAPSNMATTEKSAEPEVQKSQTTETKTIEPDATAEASQPANEEAPEVSEEVETDEPKDDVKEYDEGLKKSRNSFSSRLNHFLANFRSVDEDFFDDLEELLIESDVGYETALRISDELREEVKLENAKKKSDVSKVIVQKLVDMYGEEGKDEDNALKFSSDNTPTIFLFVGVNGAGKTTTIGKLAHRYEQAGKKVLLAAGDTFRAGAIEQLQEWGKRDGVAVQASKAHTDPASVVYDAVQRAINEDFDILLVDTAGRLQNKEGLMRELEKIKRVITRELPDAPQEVLLVLDGSTGQNALSQAKQFNETTDVSGIVLTKLDGSSQGGVVLAIRNELHIPVKLVGLGEQMDDLRDFDPEKFVYGLFKELIVGESNK